MMNKNEKEAIRLMAMEAYDILDEISGSVFFTLKNGKEYCSHRREDLQPLATLA